jgi:hypothetical protein
MKTLPYWFIGLGTLFALAGMGFGIFMSVTQDFTLAPAHAHNNLLGWVTMALYGFYYKAVPSAAATRLALAHFWIAFIGALGFGPGVALALTGKTEVVIQIASLLVILAMLIFAWTVWTNKRGLTTE